MRPNEREVGHYETILTGDLWDNDIWLEDDRTIANEGMLRDNSIMVMKIKHPHYKKELEAMIEGVTFRAGRCAISQSSSRLTIKNCKFIKNCSGYPNTLAVLECGTKTDVIGCLFESNRTSGAGAAIRTMSDSLTVTDCVFRNNYSQSGSAAIYTRRGHSSSTSLRVEGSLFCGNYSGKGQDGKNNGTVISWGYDELHMINCMFIENKGEEAGAIGLGGDSLIEQCLFVGNRGSRGAALYFGGGQAMIRGCTFFGNRAEAGDVLTYVGDANYPSSVGFENCVVWNGDNWLANEDGSDVIVHYSNVQGGWPGHGNIDADPCFVSCGYWEDSGTPADMNDDTWVMGDYHLRSQAGRWDPNANAWVQDDVTSPCIDRGSIGSPIGWEPFANGGIVNMGYYGGTAEASKSWFGQPPCETVMAGDINGDCTVDWRDFGFFGAHWLEDHVPPYPPTAQTSGPTPVDGAERVKVGVILTWESDRWATAYDVRFGTSDSPPLVATREQRMFDPGTLDFLTQYYWRIDVNGPSGPAEGPVWSFRTEANPIHARYPFPSDGSELRDEYVILTWAPGEGAVSHDVYFGMTDPPEFQMNQAQSLFDPGDVPHGRYYWRIDEITTESKVEGPVWEFELKGSGTTVR